MGGEQFCIGFIEPKIMLIYEVYFALDSNLSNHFNLNLLRNNRTDQIDSIVFNIILHAFQGLS